MYAFLLIVLFGCAFGLVLFGLSRRKWFCATAGICLGGATAFFFWFMDFWGEALWFESVGYGRRFWKLVVAKAILAGAGALLGAAVVLLLTAPVLRGRRPVRIIAVIAIGVAACVGGQWALLRWDRILLLLNSVQTGLIDPVLNRDTGFYLFVLPVYNSLYYLLLILTALGLAASIAALFLRLRGETMEAAQLGDSPEYGATCLGVASLFLVLAWGRYLERFNLMYSSSGAVTGPGWTDVHIRLPAFTLLIGLLTAAGLTVAVPFLRRILARPLSRLNMSEQYAPVMPVAAVAAITGAAWFIFLIVLPNIFQWLKVQPNEITLERPYIAHNIAFTRLAYGLHPIQEKRFALSPELNRKVIDPNAHVSENVRLWDWRALDAVYAQFQEIRLYYRFPDVDVDRYMLNKRRRHVMIAARELQLENLPAQSQTFVNRRFKYTHGNGITLTGVSEFTPEGLPRLLVKDIPPVSNHPDLTVDQPRIYYGELTETHVIVNSKEKELDYPSGSENVYIHYDGRGGVPLSSLWRKFLFGWKFDGTRLLFSGYPTRESRLMFHRRITDRVKTIAPFLQFDDDPCIVLADGRLYWIIDGYTVSSDYPYSEPAMRLRWVDRYGGPLISKFEAAGNLEDLNYVRNPVKAVVDAYNGTTDFYVFDPEDPLIRAWSGIFPGLFKPRTQMPHALLQHIRYPADMLLLQGLIYAKYHMTNPVVFYNQEDVWVRATEKYYDQTLPVEPYYILWEPPASKEPQFVLMLPFTPKNKQVLIGWIAGMCDPPNYGQLLAYQFPKGQQVLGTQQVETKIDQDPVLSGQLALWNQRGSRVIRGNVLVIPIGNSLLYVKPIYMQAETAAYPQLRLVAVMHNDRLSYAESLDKALQSLIGDAEPEAAVPADSRREQSVDQLAQEANKAFQAYLNALGGRRFDEAGDHLKTLSDTLQRLTRISQSDQPKNE